MRKDARLNEKQKTILKDYFQRSLDNGDTMEQVAKDNGIARKTLSQWKNTDEGKRLHKEWAKEMTKDAIPKYYTVLKEKALSGSYKHMELFAKLQNLFPATKQEITNKTAERDPVKDGYSKEDLEELEALINVNSPIKRVK